MSALESTRLAHLAARATVTRLSAELSDVRQAALQAERAYDLALSLDWLERARAAFPLPEGAHEDVNTNGWSGPVTSRTVTVYVARSGKGIIVDIHAQHMGDNRNVPMEERVKAPLTPHTYRRTVSGTTREARTWCERFGIAW
jgi:hypothetical protein